MFIFIWQVCVSLNKGENLKILKTASIDYNNSLNTEVQKQNVTETKKLQTKVVNSMIFGIHLYSLFQ